MPAAAGCSRRYAVLEQAAILHDVGYSPSIALTGFHALDGARYLRSVGYDERVTNLVAHHSCAPVEAELRGLSGVLADFDREDGLAADCLIFCDMTTRPDGGLVDIEEGCRTSFAVMARRGWWAASSKLRHPS